MSRMWSPIVCTAAAAAVLFASYADASAQARRIATLAPPGSTWMKVLDKGALAIAKATDGRVTTMYYTGGSQGDEKDVIRKMRIGGLDGAALTSMGLSMIYKGIRVLELPRMFATTGELDYVRRRMWPHFQRKFEKKGYILGPPGDIGFVYFMSRRPVRTRADLKGMKVWMWSNNEMVRGFFKKVGMKGVPLGLPGVLPALSSGKIDAAYSSYLGALALQWGSKIRYVGTMPVVYAIGGSVLRKKVWEQASPADRAIQKKISKRLSKTMRRMVRRDNKSARKRLARMGVKVIPTPPDMITEFDEGSEEVWKLLVGKEYSQWELDTVLRLRQEYRDKQAKRAAK